MWLKLVQFTYYIGYTRPSDVVGKETFIVVVDMRTNTHHVI